MLILGIESTAHTFGVGIVDSTGKVLANIFDSFTAPEKGMIPHEVAEHHQKVKDHVCRQALEAANISWDKISAIAYSAGPGLDPSLWAGYAAAKQWAVQHTKQLIGVNHPAAHLSIGKIIHHLHDPCYLYVSGVNTQIIIEKEGEKKRKYVVLGETLDIGLGNMLDKFGRIIGLGFPAGPQIEELAKLGKYIELPYVVKGMDVSFSGILTKVEQLWTRKTTWREFLKKQGKDISLPHIGKEVGAEGKAIIARIYQEELNKPISKEDLCFSLQETCFAMCAEVAERAMAHTGKKELLLVGGVGANQRFCQMLDIMCKEREAQFYKVPMDLARDNGAMIAWEGFLRKSQSGDIGVKPHWRIDEV